MKRRFAFLLAALLTMSVLTACGDNKDSSGTASVASAPESSAASTAGSEADSEDSDSAGEKTPSSDGEAVELSFMWWGSQGRHDYTQEMMDLYIEENPNVSFKATPGGWDGYFEKLSTQAAGGTMSDIIQMDYQYISTYSKNNTLADLQPFADDGILDLSQMDENMIESGRVDGKLTGIAPSESIFTFAYNPDLFAEAGVEEPSSDWTWADFEDMVMTIHEKTGKYGFTYPQVDINLLSYMLRQQGLDLFADDGKSLGYEDDQVFIDYLDMQKRFCDAGALPNPDQRIQLNSLGKEASPVITGDAAMTCEWNNYAVIAAPINPNVKLITPPYADNGEKALWLKPAMFFSIAESSDNKEEAVKFVDWFMNNEGANDIMMAERGVPSSAAIREYLSPKLDEKQQEMFDYAELARDHVAKTPIPEPEGITEINKLLTDIMDQVLYDTLSSADAAEQFRTESNGILGRN